MLKRLGFLTLLAGCGSSGPAGPPPLPYVVTFQGLVQPGEVSCRLMLSLAQAGRTAASLDVTATPGQTIVDTLRVPDNGMYQYLENYTYIATVNLFGSTLVDTLTHPVVAVTVPGGSLFGC